MYFLSCQLSLSYKLVHCYPVKLQSIKNEDKCNKVDTDFYYVATMRLRLIMKKTILVISMIFSTQLCADVPVNQVDEVSHLLDFVKNSKCIINRNGTDHVGEKGVKHIASKYDYFRDDIKSTEDFIQYSATKSTMSGKYYMVTCPGKKTIQTQDWLLDELKRFRKEVVSSEVNMKDLGVTACTEPRPEICAMQYVPVCARFKGDVVKTYSSGCSACSDAKVISYKPGKCK